MASMSTRKREGEQVSQDSPARISMSTASTIPLRILHVEDAALDAELIEATLAAEGFVCDATRVETRAAFVEAIEGGRFDIILSDFRLPSFAGLCALELALERCPDTPFIFVSGLLGEEFAIETLKKGATDYVLKDRLSRLVPSVNRALGEVEQRDKRKSLEDQLRQAHRMESIGTLAGGVAHDFNNLLTVIIGNAQLALAKIDAGDPTYESLVEIEKVGKRAADLTGQLLVFSRRQKLAPRIVDLNDSLPDFMKMLERIIGANIEVLFETACNLPLLTADPAQIEQAVMNLAVNARDAMPSGGRITIKAREVALDKAYCEQHPLAKPGRYVRIEVSDNGTGIDAATKKRIFEPFFTTKEPGKGTGLGLSVVYGVIKQHDGFIEVDSVLGRGTTFALCVPVGVPRDAEQVREVLDPELRGGAETILVAEDEESLRTLVQQVLGGLGYRVMLARDGLEAVEIFAQHRDQIDLVTLDMVMPRLSGRDAYERIRQFKRNVPVIFVTGYAGETAGPPYLEETGAELLHKPYSVDMLGRKIRQVLDQGRRSSPATGR